MPDRRDATVLAKGALNRGIAAMSCDFAGQRVRRAHPERSRVPAVSLESVEGHERIEVLFERRVRGEWVGDGGGDHVH